MIVRRLRERAALCEGIRQLLPDAVLTPDADLSIELLLGSASPVSIRSDLYSLVYCFYLRCNRRG